MLYEIAGVLVGVSVCEDLWFPDGPVAEQAAAGAALVVNANASPYAIGRLAERRGGRPRTRVDEARCAIAYVNQVGGQDELVFDGGSFVVDADGRAWWPAPRSSRRRCSSRTSTFPQPAPGRRRRRWST